jgi:hypothetical protein
MKTILLDIDKQNSPEELKDAIKKQSPEEGDTVHLFTKENSPIILMGFLVMVVMAILSVAFFKKKNKEETENLLKGIFDKYKTPEKLEEHIEEEYGIKIEVKQPSNEDDEWRYSSMLSFSKSYSIEEPDYDNIVVKEPNPEYKPWKKDQ